MSAAPGSTVVTGAAGGIGGAVAQRLQGDGPLVLLDIDAAALHAAAGSLTGAQVEVVRCDVRDADAVGTAAERIATLGPVARLVCAAGIGPAQTDDGQQILEVDLRGSARMMAALRPLMVAGSAIVNIGSVASARSPLDADAALVDPLGDQWEATWSRVRPDAWTAYAYSKRGLWLHSRRRAVEWARDGVRVNIVSPSQTATALGAATIAENPEIAEFVSRIPMGRMAQPAEVADAVAFLAGPTASFITGVELFVDGGAGAAGQAMKPPTQGASIA
jgi:NAD(P)-dependent dehydrogenase (short-subunit alcohol dehydrogenase family)